MKWRIFSVVKTAFSVWPSQGHLVTDSGQILEAASEILLSMKLNEHEVDPFWLIFSVVETAPGCEGFIELQEMQYKITTPGNFEDGFHECRRLNTWPAMFKTEGQLDIIRYIWGMVSWQHKKRSLLSLPVLADIQSFSSH